MMEVAEESLRRTDCKRSAGSFRDPSGFVFECEGRIYRQINTSYASSYTQLMESGLYRDLVDRGYLIAHQEVQGPVADPSRAWRILRPDPIDFVSYPYEWCFSQLQDAAVLTLDLQLSAIEHGMTLKDASAYNVQFKNGRPVFIDTLSFEPYIEGKPWVAYRQFCRHFLVPLALMARRDVRLSQLLRVHIDGIPLDMGSALLGRQSWLSPGLLMHVHLHARSEKHFSATDAEVSPAALRLARVSRSGLLALLQGLRRLVESLCWKPGATEWGNYYEATNYSSQASAAKARCVEEFLEQAAPQSVWDLGANTGVFSRLAAARGVPTVAFDIDPAAVEAHYCSLRMQKQAVALLPLLLDLSNPSPGLGWHHAERDSLIDRGPVDCVMALALLHHLRIGNNVPMEQLSRFFASTCRRYLIIEFVPKADSQVQRLLRGREDIFDDYEQTGFESAFSAYFDLIDQRRIDDSQRVLFLMRIKHQTAERASTASTINGENT